MKERAFILPAVVLILSLLVATIIPKQDSLILGLRFDAEKLLALKASNQAANTVMTEAFTFSAATSTRILNKCFSNTAKASRIEVRRTFCSSFHTPSASLLNRPLLDISSAVGSTNIPSLDFQKVFFRSKECSLAGGKTISAYSLPLSTRSAFSSNFCELLENQILDVRTIGANLKIPRTTGLGASSSLAAKGFIHVTSTISLSAGRQTIAAAGDLLLSNLAATQATELTLISATGDVRVLALTGPIKLRVFAARNVSLPNNIEFASRGFEDLKLEFLPIGFMD